MQIKLISDIGEIRNFIEKIVPKCKLDEVYFCSLSARKKYLTTEERELYQLSDTEMFNKTIINTQSKNTEFIINKIIELESSANNKLTRNGLHIPQKSLICYWNLNPKNSTNAYNSFTKIMTDHLIYAIKDEQQLSNFNKSVNILENCFQNSNGTKHWIDIDIDLTEDGKQCYNLLKQVVEFLDELDKRKVEYHIIDTKGGYHILMKRDTINFNYPALVNLFDFNIKNIAFDEVDNPTKVEIVVNKNEMVPLPGTFQSNYPVSIIYKSWLL